MSATGEAVADFLQTARPLLVEAAAAILIVGAAMDAVLSVEAFVASVPETAGARFLGGLSLAIGVGLVVLGVLIRSGRAWLAAINIVAVVAFLEFASATAAGLLFAALDIFVVAALLRARWWFTWTAPEAVVAPEPGRRPPLGRWGAGD